MDIHALLMTATAATTVAVLLNIALAISFARAA
jgi:hypothetical protein